MRRDIMTEKDRDHIIFLAGKGCTTKEIAELTRRPLTTINANRRIYDLVVAGNIEEARASAVSSNNSAIFRWACKRHGVDPQPPKEKPIEAPLILEEVLHPSEPVWEAEPPKEPAVPGSVEDAVFVASRLIIDKVHEDLRDMTDAVCAKLERLIDVGQRCSVDMVQKSNANADNLLREVQAIKSHVEMIRSYSKKRK